MHNPGWPRCLCNSLKLCFGVDNVHRKQNQNTAPCVRILTCIKPYFFFQSSSSCHLTEWERTINLLAICTMNPPLSCEREKPKGE